MKMNNLNRKRQNYEKYGFFFLENKREIMQYVLKNSVNILVA
jgi:hypothetical protein